MGSVTKNAGLGKMIHPNAFEPKIGTQSIDRQRVHADAHRSVSQHDMAHEMIT